MEFGTKYRAIEDVVAILEEHLGISMRRDTDSETGVSYGWSADLDEFGMSFYGIDVDPAKILNYEEGKMQLQDMRWAGFSFVIGVSKQLTEEISRIQDLIRQGILEAKEIPEWQPR
ncbi:MAG: hypothetical protein JNJ73_00950 [Hyphomonadaceae bacterium]|nr:hypothetical protein [Hyphomonadaceae bacterium]